VETKQETYLVGVDDSILLSCTADFSSTIALNFSAALDDIFNLGPSGELAKNVEQKYGSVTQRSGSHN